MKKGNRKPTWHGMLLLALALCLAGCGKEEEDLQQENEMWEQTQVVEQADAKLNNGSYYNTVEDASDAVMAHWEEKLLAEGVISSEEEICYWDCATVNDTWIQNNGLTYDRLCFYVVTDDDAEKFRFYVTAADCEYEDGRIKLVQLTDYDADGVSSLEAAKDVAEAVIAFYGITMDDEWDAWQNGKLGYWEIGNMAKRLGAYVKKQDAERFQKLQNPISALEDLTGLQGGSAEWIPTDYWNGMLVYTFRDGTQGVYYMWQTEDGVWYPGGFAELKEQEEAVNEARQIGDRLESVTAQELEGVTPDLQEGEFRLLWAVSEKDIALYGLTNGNRMVLQVEDKVYPVYLYWDTNYYFPDFYVGDYDEDGAEEYAIRMQTDRGTGVSVYTLMLLEIEESGAQIRTFYGRDWSRQLRERVTYSYAHGVLEVKADGVKIYQSDAYRQYLEDAGLEFAGLCWDDIVDFKMVDGQWYLEADAGFYNSEAAVPQYETYFTLRCPVLYHPDGTFTLGSITAQEPVSEE